MVRLQTYAGFSFLAAITVIYHAFKSREQFYPAMVYLSTSKICLVLLLNMGLVIMCIMWQLVKRLFLGSLREAEVERLNEQSWREVMEILFAITIFRQDFSVTFIGMVTALLLIKALHWLAQKRVEYIETTPSVPVLSHIRIISFMGFLLLLDCLFLYSSLKPLIQTWKPSVALFFSFEYMILATTTVATFVKYVFYVSDMLMEGQWERKAVCTFYLELIRDLLHLSMYIFFFFAIFINYGVPLHLIRELYETFRNFKIRISDYVRYRKITSNMNERFPDATPEELNASDATCIICREEMVTAKKLLCGHLFHVHCLRSWLERQHTCPTCRSLVVPPENGSASSGRQHGFTPENRQPAGSATAGTSTQAPGDGAAHDNLSQHQGRLQAAARAASLYEKSFVYPPTNTFLQSPAYQFPPVTSTPRTDASSGGINELTGETAASGHFQQHQPLFPSGYPFIFIPSAPSLNNAHSEGSAGNSDLQTEGSAGNSDLQTSILKAQETLIQHQIEFLKSHLQIIQQQKSDRSKVTPEVPDCKGKAVAISTPDCVSNCGPHGSAEGSSTD